MSIVTKCISLISSHLQPIILPSLMFEPAIVIPLWIERFDLHKGLIIAVAVA